MRSWWRRRKPSPVETPPSTTTWVKVQVDGAASLQGRVIESWAGIELAIRESRDQTTYTFEDPQAPCLQMFDVAATTDDGQIFRVNNYQNDGDFGLKVETHGLPPQDLGSPGYRLRTLAELPVGEVSRVAPSLSEIGDLTEIELVVGGHLLLLVAGEIYETATDRLEFHRFDESVLVFRSRADYESIDWVPPLEEPRSHNRSDIGTI